MNRDSCYHDPGGLVYSGNHRRWRGLRLLSGQTQTTRFRYSLSPSYRSSTGWHLESAFKSSPSAGRASFPGQMACITRPWYARRQSDTSVLLIERPVSGPGADNCRVGCGFERAGQVERDPKQQAYDRGVTRSSNIRMDDVSLSLTGLRYIMRAT